MATFTLRELAPDSVEAAEALVEATRDPDLQVRRAAFTAMASLLAPPPAVAARLLEAVQGDDDAASRRLAALALGEMGGANPQAISSEAIRRLREEAQRSQDPDLQRAIRRALERIEPSAG
jgi:HEAT repeat protein